MLSFYRSLLDNFFLNFSLHPIYLKSYIDSLIETDKITAIKILQQKFLKDFTTLEWQNHHSDIFRLVTEELANADPKQTKVKTQPGDLSFSVSDVS